MLIHYKDDIQFVTEFPCFLGHPVLHIIQRLYIVFSGKRLNCNLSSNFVCRPLGSCIAICLKVFLLLRVPYQLWGDKELDEGGVQRRRDPCNNELRASRFLELPPGPAKPSPCFLLRLRPLPFCLQALHFDLRLPFLFFVYLLWLNQPNIKICLFIVDSPIV